MQLSIISGQTWIVCVLVAQSGVLGAAAAAAASPESFLETQILRSHLNLLNQNLHLNNLRAIYVHIIVWQILA